MKTKDKRSLTSRENAKKSTGPKTPEGKQASSRNALKHGYYIQTAVMPGENQEIFYQFLADHVELFKPTNPVEFDLVESIAVTKWRLNRITSAENNLIFDQFAAMEAQLAKDYTHINPAAFWGMGAIKLEQENQAVTLFGRMESRLRRQYQTFVSTLINLRKNLPSSDLQTDTQPKPSCPPPATTEPTEPGETTPQPAAKNGGTNLILLQPVQTEQPTTQPQSPETQPSPVLRYQTASAGRL